MNSSNQSLIGEQDSEGLIWNAPLQATLRTDMTYRHTYQSPYLQIA